MKKTTLLLLIFSFFSIHLLAQKDKDQDKDELNMAESSAKMIAAKHEYNKHNNRGALTLFREVLKSEPNNASARYWTAKCHYALKKYKLAKKYLEQSIEINPNNHKDIEFFMGTIEHRLGNTQEAIKYFKNYINSTTNNAQIAEARRLIRQCKFAELMMDDPVNVTITNMGDEVNSRFDDYTPCITADGKLLVFTSRRSDTKGGEIDKQGDYKFFEDIYYTQWDEETKSWSRSEGLEGDINTESYDAVLSIAPSGEYLFAYLNNKDYDGDIFISYYLKDSQKWTKPERLPRPINTSYYESSASITADGQTLYFVSERPGSKGRGDIWVSQKIGENSWSNPKNLGKMINTAEDEKFVFIHPDGKTLYFASEGHQSMGSYDIFKSEFVNGQWSLPVNLGYPINTVNEESTFSLTSDNKTLLIAAEYENTFGERDIYSIDVSNYDLLSSGYDKSGYGSVTFEVLNNKNKPQKSTEIQIYYDNYDEIILKTKTNGTGRVTVNLPLNRGYKIKAISPKKYKEDTFILYPKDEGETAIVRQIKF